MTSLSLSLVSLPRWGKVGWTDTTSSSACSEKSVLVPLLSDVSSLLVTPPYFLRIGRFDVGSEEASGFFSIKRLGIELEVVSVVPILSRSQLRTLGSRRHWKTKSQTP
jgi:hypothetical protein